MILLLMIAVSLPSLRASLTSCLPLTPLTPPAAQKIFLSRKNDCHFVAPHLRSLSRQRLGAAVNDCRIASFGNTLKA